MEYATTTRVNVGVLPTTLAGQITAGARAFRRVLTPLKHCPHLLEGQTVCMWRQGSTRASSRWDPSQFTCVFAVLALESEPP